MNRLSQLAAFTLPLPVSLPQEHQKQTDAHDIDDHHTPSVPKTQPVTEVSVKHNSLKDFILIHSFLFSKSIIVLIIMSLFQFKFIK